MKILDWLAICVTALVVVVFGVISYRSAGAGAQLEVLSGDSELLFSLEEDRTIVVEGPLGETIIVVEAGRVRVVESPCPAKICISSGSISRSGEWIACLPNRIFIAVRGKDDDIDAITMEELEEDSSLGGCCCAACLTV